MAGGLRKRGGRDPGSEAWRAGSESVAGGTRDWRYTGKTFADQKDDSLGPTPWDALPGLALYREDLRRPRIDTCVKQKKDTLIDTCVKNIN